jgi:hypothetical protein
VKPRVGLAGAGRVKNPAAVGKASTVVNQKAGALGKAAAVIAGGTRSAAGVDVAKPEGEVKAEDEREVPVECDQIVPINVSSEAPDDASEEYRHGCLEVPARDVGSHEDGGSVPTSPLLEGEVLETEGSVREDNVTSPPPVSGSDHEHDHDHEYPGDEACGTPQLSEEQEAELLQDDVRALPEPSEQEVAEASAHSGAEEYLEKVVPPYQPSVLPTGEQVDEEKQEGIERIPDDV